MGAAQQVLLSFAAAAAAGTSDNFNRADGALGANWTGNGNITVSGNQAVNASAADGYAIWAGTVTNDQFSQVTVKTLPSILLYVYVRSDSAGQNGYRAVFDIGGNTVTLYEEVTGTNNSNLGSGAVTLAANDVIYISVIGTSLTVKVNGVTKATGTSSLYASGKPGFGTFNDGAVDDWSGGTAP